MYAADPFESFFDSAALPAPIRRHVATAEPSRHPCHRSRSDGGSGLRGRPRPAVDNEAHILWRIGAS